MHPPRMLLYSVEPSEEIAADPTARSCQRLFSDPKSQVQEVIKTQKHPICNLAQQELHLQVLQAVPDEGTSLLIPQQVSPIKTMKLLYMANLTS